MDFVEAIEQLSEEMAVDAGRNIEAAVMACPGWNVRDLLDHVASVQRFWATIVRGRVTDRSRVDRPAERPLDMDALTWHRSASAELVSALRGCPIEEPLWTWWSPDQSARFVRRRQLNEVAMHGWDARQAIGDPRPIPTEIALIGLQEFVEVMSHDIIDGSAPVPIRLVANDIDWTATLFGSDESPIQHELSAKASDLLLQLWGRHPIEDREIAEAIAMIDLS